jgi:nucleotide-binding universal stress UspA family protein
MIKDIVVNLAVGERTNQASEYAISLAAAFDAHLTGIAFLYDPIVPISGAGYIPGEVIESQERDSKAAAKAAIDRFTAASDRVGISADSLTVNASLAGVGEMFSRIARRFDLSVVGQAEPEKSAIEEIIAEAALFESGRPVVVVPYIQKDPFKLDQVMVCWDGSRAAARAIGDAVPLLKKSKRVEIVIVANERGKEEELAGADLGEHLARHDLNVEVKCTVLGDVDVADILLSHAADSGADFMVMGGYGHSRLREFVLGGVTRSIFRTMTVPVLMAH